MMTASDALMLPVLSTSLDQVQARYGECVSTAPLHAHTATIHNNHMIRDSFTNSNRFHWSKQLTRQTRPNARLRLPMETAQADLRTSLGETTCKLRYDSCLRYVTQSAKHGCFQRTAYVNVCFASYVPFVMLS